MKRQKVLQLQAKAGFMVGLLGSLTWIPVVMAQNTTCVPLGTGVPPNNRPPNWWDSTLPEYRLKLDERTWQGAVSHSDGSPNAEHVDFRAIHRQDSLFLSWIVKVDPQLNPNPSGLQAQDALWFGIEQGAGKKPIVFRLSLSTNQEGLEASPNYAVWAWEANATTQPMTLVTPPLFASGNQGGAPLPPQWFTKAAKLWARSGSGEDWAFQLIIPTNGTNPATDGLSVDPNFRVWYQLSVKLSAVTNPVPYTWPRSGTSVITFDGLNGPGLAQWGPFTRASAPPEATCLGNLTIASYDDIGTKDPLSSVKINVPKPPKPLAGPIVPPTNTFFVRPTNRTLAGIPTDQITARFWIANWGSQPNNWENVPNPDADLWKEIPQPNPPPSNSLPVGNSLAANQIEIPWKMSACQWFNFLSKAEYPDNILLQWLSANGVPCPNSGGVMIDRYAAKLHQCLLVELVTLPGSPTRTFLKKSFWNNLDVVVASTFTRDAAISVQGLDPTEGTGPKTVYLYVQTFNMPRRLSPGASGLTHNPRTDSLARRSRADTVREPFDPVFGERRIDLAMPTYWVHVYRETAESIPVGTGKQAILRPQSSFGYRVLHEGDLEGWRHSIRGAEGAHLEQLAPNFYRLTVPNDSFAVVTTTIEALPFRRYALSLHAGVSFPNGNFNTTHDAGFGITADAEYWWKPRFAVAALLGYHRFGGEAANPDLDLFHASAALEARITTGSPSVLVDAGGGVYHLSPGSTDPGIHGGVGIEFDVSPTVSLGVTGRVHTVFTTGSNTTFSSLQAGGRIRF